VILTIIMVQTRSKYRLLQQNAAAAPMEEPSQPSSTTSKKEKLKKNKEVGQLTNLSSCSLVDPPAASLPERADGTSNTCEDQHELSRSPPFTFRRAI
jgi:hypothetical protein